MAVIKFTNSKGSLKKILDYIIQKEKTDAKLISGQACMPETALNEMLAIKKGFGKEHGRQYIHIVQSFAPDERVTHDQAHNIAVKLAERFDGYQALIATHRDRNHVHSHIVLNSVAYETGLKFQQSKNEMQAFKDYSDALCRDVGLSVIENDNKGMGIGMNELHAATKGDSWKFRLINAIDTAMQKSADKSSFIAEMERMGYTMNWTDTRKYITYTTPEGMKCRDNRLHDPKYSKEAMEYALNGGAEKSEQAADGRALHPQPALCPAAEGMGQYDGQAGRYERQAESIGGTAGRVSHMAGADDFGRGGENRTCSQTGGRSRNERYNDANSERIERGDEDFVSAYGGLLGKAGNEPENHARQYDIGSNRRSGLGMYDFSSVVFAFQELTAVNNVRRRRTRGELSKSAKRELAKKLESQGLDWEEER